MLIVVVVINVVVVDFVVVIHVVVVDLRNLPLEVGLNRIID